MTAKTAPTTRSATGTIPILPFAANCRIVGIDPFGAPFVYTQEAPSIMVAVASVLISAGKRRRVTNRPLAAPIAAADRETSEDRDRQRCIVAARNASAEHKAQREHRANGQIDPAHEHDKRLTDRDESKRRDLLAEKQQAVRKQERRNQRARDRQEDGEAYERRHGAVERRPLGDGVPRPADRKVGARRRRHQTVSSRALRGRAQELEPSRLTPASPDFPTAASSPHRRGV